MITLKGKPISVNHLYATMCRGNFPTKYTTQKGKELKASYELQVKEQWLDKIITGDVSLSIGFFFDTKRKQDIDNFAKVTLDSLTGIVFEDDSQVKELYMIKHFDKENPRTEIVIKEL
jgi:crossover junction endodeoxyribonuclease RusA